MLLALPQGQEQAASVMPCPYLHILRILHDCCTSALEVVRIVQVRTRTALLHSEQVAGMVPDKIRADDGAARPVPERRDNRTRHSRRAARADVHRNDDIAAGNKDASDPGPIRIHVAGGVRSTDHQETLGLRYAP